MGWVVALSYYSFVFSVPESYLSNTELVVSSNTNLIYTGGKVGVGIAAPSNTLDVVGTVKARAYKVSVSTSSPSNATTYPGTTFTDIPGLTQNITISQTGTPVILNYGVTGAAAAHYYLRLLINGVEQLAGRSQNIGASAGTGAPSGNVNVGATFMTTSLAAGTHTIQVQGYSSDTQGYEDPAVDGHARFLQVTILGVP
ncbi:MAG: hypothetical protein AB7F28_05020 [Candidatus Margulisiibacteriota bacterium]